ncbi:ubiquinone biosynthesis protein UbiE [Frankia sp. CcI156]|uniref:UbiE/COQ5 methyltransferase n=1 Tax=Frankia casuarinae (strain DSM 45818 / CECT 9043 / HFP020203 / CcI3) TaxID=106370 RepID=Q2JC43_FRACC|nr:MULTISPECIES: class I SAM-dependent methyltransferase [Frankia]ABD11149.1 UbiE/COQ5 methyltransferase [Frankia casuarinae]OFB42771.1 ubiquinone biosynthesis protein UbiE [Frankia sp. CgIM4]OHV51923.1 ubiquinone biosynthesis protein UbiE [Frankia sp. CgIS1]ONH23680.1 ubiquinone biosynthesis protein UbiE [Frankia sp. CcI156]
MKINRLELGREGTGIDRENVVGHFSARARTYDMSSSWCTDDELGAVIVRVANAGPTDRVLDVACGTGLVSRLFHGRVGAVIGVDITEDMAAQARPHLDELVISPAEELPWPNASFDVVVCRQGVQFMRLPDAVREMVRVLRPGGRLILINLCAYGPDDRDEYFEVLRLRNPVRRHFFLPEDMAKLVASSGCTDLRTERYVSIEDVDVWSDNGAIDESAREAIREVYRSASPEFSRLHSVHQRNGLFVDHMLFVIASGCKPGGDVA